ncbi:MAG: hypothetical protein ACJ74U_00540 [Jatrophihabitantaceae bacterium]
MLSAGWLVLAVVLTVLLTAWVVLTLTRLDRLHARVDAAQAAMDAQLVRRAAALQHLAEMSGNGVPPELAGRLASSARTALAAPGADPAALTPASERQRAENQVGHAISALAEYRDRLPAAAAEELAEAAERVLIARRFFNDAVRDTRTLRARRMPRLLHLAGRRELPRFFDIDDSSLFGPGAAKPDSPGADQPNTNSPRTNSPSTDPPSTDPPSTDPPSTDPPSTELSSTDLPSTELSSSDLSSTGSPTAGTPQPGPSTAGSSDVDSPTADSPSTESGVST